MDFRSTKTSFADDLGTEVVDIYVGPERKRYVVHKKPLTTQSEYFNKALNGHFKEAEENSIHLKEDDPAAVALLIGWIYRGVIPGTESKISPFAKPIFASTTGQAKVEVPMAETINGTYFPFAPTVEAEPNSSYGMRNSFQHICLQQQYISFSPEELRLADYKLGRKHYHGQPPVQPPAQPPTHTTNMFGPVNPIAAQSIWANYRNPFPAPTPPAGNIFGTAPPPASQPGQTGLTPTTSQPAVTQTQPAVTQSTGLFGNLNQGTTTLFGNTGQTTQRNQTQQGGGLFGNAPPPQAAATPNAPQQTPSNSIFGNPASGTTQSQSQHSGGLFSGLGPNPQQSQPQQGGGLFGGFGGQRPPLFSNNFNAPPAQQAGGLFGNAGSSVLAQAAQAIAQGQGSSNTLFGNRPSLFGQSNQTSLFGNARGNLFATSDEPRPGEFGYTRDIEHPEPAGEFLPGIPRCDPLGVLTDEQQSHQQALLHLCLFAESKLWVELFNAAIEAYVRGELNLHRPIPAEHVALIYERTPSDSTLRAYVLESMCTHDDNLAYMDLARQHDELLEDVLIKLPNARRRDGAAPWEEDELVRSFHMMHIAKGKESEHRDVEIGGLSKDAAESGEIA